MYICSESPLITLETPNQLIPKTKKLVKRKKRKKKVLEKLMPSLSTVSKATLISPNVEPSLPRTESNLGKKIQTVLSYTCLCSYFYLEYLNTSTIFLYL